MLLETFDSLMVILVKLDQRLYKLEGYNEVMGPHTDTVTIKEDIAYTKTLIGRYYGACKAAENAKPFTPGIPSSPVGPWLGEDGKRQPYRRPAPEDGR